MAVKTSLRQFQQELAQKLSAARAGEASVARLGVQSGGSLWLMDLGDAGEIVPVTDILSVPLTKPWFVGMANVRGSLMSVSDLSLFNGGEPVARGPENRLVLAGPKFGINSALLVTRMLGLRSARDFTAVEESLKAHMPWQGAAWRDAEGRVWHELNLQALLSHDEFLQVGF
jgi:twitching motility protein PilI